MMIIIIISIHLNKRATKEINTVKLFTNYKIKRGKRKTTGRIHETWLLKPALKVSKVFIVQSNRVNAFQVLGAKEGKGMVSKFVSSDVRHSRSA